VRGKARGAKTREFGEPNDRSFRVAQRRRSRGANSFAQQVFIDFFVRMNSNLQTAPKPYDEGTVV
jgi:hypothetical protein